MFGCMSGHGKVEKGPNAERKECKADVSESYLRDGRDKRLS